MEETVHLVVDSGPQKGTQYSVPKDGALLGRSSGCTFLIRDPELSRRHCRFFFKGGELWVSDLGSANGTKVNDRAVQEAQLQLGDRVQIGDTVIKVVNDGVKAALRVKPDPDFVSVDPWPPEEEAKQRRIWVPLWIELPAWALLLVWLMFLAYSLVFTSPPQSPPPQSLPQRLPPREATAAMPKGSEPVAAAARDEEAGQTELGASVQTNRMGAVEAEVARCLVREDFRKAVECIRKGTSESSVGTGPESDALIRFIVDISKMDTLIASAFSEDIGKVTTLWYDGQSQTVIPRAVAGSKISVVRTGETEAVTLPVSKLGPRERSRRLGKADTPPKSAMQFILAFEAGDYQAAGGYATNSGPLAAAFAELAADKR